MQQRRIAEVELGGGEAVEGELFGEEEASCDVELFVVGVATQLNDFATIEKGGGDSVERVGGADEEHLAQVDRNVDVVILSINRDE